MTQQQAAPHASLGAELAEYVRQAELQKGDVSALITPLSGAQLGWRPAPNRWSIGEHLAHLPKTIWPYLETIDSAVARARSGGLLGAGPYRGGWIGEWFVRSMGPPVKVRVKTLKRLVPAAGEPKARLLSDFAAAQDELIASVRKANGVDLGRAKMRSPYFKPLKLTVDQAFRVMLAHNRRHIWHMRQVLGEPGIPGGRGRDG